ncbi:pantetheine-phosphate adenylyltransferase [secondary endosymbiont of Heteropsylla cubana]|uniref:Phosphopantetheine adenylyltransferase n=1 Tax=secondary endosymbiont of Heteropsylla cubana TaxID=134287 RepID=J3YSW0_9ENTR|nr:pantetheine-phosphate adenylyltransferase [secondary endosymbiont of Heteropsylla cubana]AFP85408.1 pantetheine-phosphate adenylyltransferase [secondary endosymbiont of Heteropsylla cubana]
MIKKAIYPGTFDPITNGHLDLLTRATKIFDIVVLAISANPQKCPLFNLKERLSMAIQVTSHLPTVRVAAFSNLIVDFARHQKGNILIRGVRTIMDVNYEMQLAKMNRYFMPTLETVFMLSDQDWSYVSSSLVKDVALHGGDVDYFLPEFIAKELQEKLSIS